MRTPDSDVPSGSGRATHDGGALGGCGRGAVVVRHDPESPGLATTLLCRGCGLAALGPDGF